MRSRTSAQVKPASAFFSRLSSRWSSSAFCSACCVFEDRANLVERDARKQREKPAHRNAILEIFKQGRYGHARASKQPSAADASRIALDRITGGPIDHGKDASTIAMRRLTATSSRFILDYQLSLLRRSAMRVCQPGPVAFQRSMTSTGSRMEMSLRGFAERGRQPLFTTARASAWSVSSEILVLMKHE